jgi:phosphonate transport system substrate-binding protein
MKRKSWLTIAALFVLLMMASGCRQRSGLPYISLEEAQGVNHVNSLPQEDSETFDVAIASITSARESIVYYEALLLYLGEELGRPIRIVQRKTYAEINELLRAGTVDLGFICTYSYVLGQRDFGLELLAAPVINGLMEYNSYIIVHKDTGIESFADLTGMRFAFTDPISNSGRLYPLYLLHQMGERPETFFSHFIFTYSHDNSVRAVAERLVDGAAVDSLVFYYMADREPQVFADIAVIDKSPPFGIQPVVVRPGLDEVLKEKLMTFFLTLHEDEKGRLILQDLKFDRFMPQNEAAYNSIREMAEIIMR